MDTKEIKIDSISILEFLGYEHAPEIAKDYYIKKGVGGKFTKATKYHSSWDCLMPVVDKIESLYDGGIEVGIHFGATIISQCRDTDDGTLHGPVDLFVINLSEGYDFPDKIGFTYHAVIEFLKWFKKQ